MPIPRDDPIFRWQYTILGDDSFNDGRSPEALTLAAQGTSPPAVVFQTDPPTACGPWWLPQDLAFGGDVVVSVLHVSKIIGAIPVLEQRLLVGSEDVDQLASHVIRVPVYPPGTPPDSVSSVRAVRRLLRSLASQSEPDLATVADCAEAITELHYEAPERAYREVRLVLLRFRHRVRSGLTAHVAIVIDSTLGWRGAESEARTRGIEQEPIRLSEAAGIRRLADLRGSRGDMDGASRLLRQAAELGDAEAMVSLGHLCRRVPGEEYAEAAQQWFRSAAELGHERAALFVGLSQAERGDFDGDDGAEAWWRRATERGIAEAATLLGDRYRDRNDFSDAEKWWHLGADLGDGDAATRIGRLRSEAADDWFESDGPDSAEFWWQTAVSLGSKRALYELGRRRLFLEMLDGDDGALSWMIRASDAGIEEAAYFIGLIRRHQCEIDGPDGALSWLRKSADSGHVEAMRGLGEIKHARGDLDGDDGAESWYRRAADKGDADSFLWLGGLRVHEDGITGGSDADARPDDETPEYWWLQAANAGSADAMYNLGVKCFEGNDIKGAGDWWIKASEAGHEGAMSAMKKLILLLQEADEAIRAQKEQVREHEA